MITFIKEHRDVCGVEPICGVLKIALSTFFAHLAVENDPDLASDRAKMDAELRSEIKRVWGDNQSVYGARKVWHAMKREGHDLACCTVERLLRDIGLEGVRRGKKIKTPWLDKALPCPQDLLNRQFRATMPNQLWVSDSQLCLDGARVCLCGVCDRHLRQQDRWLARIQVEANTDWSGFTRVGALWKAAFRKPDLSQRPRKPISVDQITARLADAGLEPSVGSAGDSYDNARADPMIGLFKADVIHRLGSWKSVGAVEWKTLKWVDWFNKRRLLEPIGYRTPTEAEEAYYANMNTLDKVA